MIGWIHPGVVVFLGGFLIPFIKWRKVKLTYFLLLPIAGLTLLVFTSMGLFDSVPSWPYALFKWRIPFLQYSIILGKIDKLSMIFAYIYLIAAFCMNIYALKVKNDWEHVAAMAYVGSALGAVFAGDFLTLFFFLETMSWGPVFLLWFRGTKKSMGAGIRYALWHHLSGACILAGIVIHLHKTGSIELMHLPWGWKGEFLAYHLMLLGFIINSATTPFHSWLSDTYSEATPSGSIYMTAYTTKTAIYCLIRTFSGVSLLMWMGAIQPCLPFLWLCSKMMGEGSAHTTSYPRLGTWLLESALELKWGSTEQSPMLFAILYTMPCFIWGQAVSLSWWGRPNSMSWVACTNICPSLFGFIWLGAFRYQDFPYLMGLSVRS